MMRVANGKFFAVCLAMLAVACSPTNYVDDDDSCTRAKPLPPIVVGVKDELNTKRGDLVDCKQIKYWEDASARVEYRVGTPFESHNIKGLITVYNDEGHRIRQKLVEPTVKKYVFEFDVKAQQLHYVKFEATEGAYGYKAMVTFSKQDPCSQCASNEDCVNKQCVKRNICDPECDDNERCDGGRCVSVCDPPCSRRKYCDPDSERCITKRKPCRPACKRGYYCRSGKCKKRRPSGCSGGCGAGEVCKSGKCVKIKPKKCPPCPKPTDVCNASTGYKCQSKASASAGPIVGRITNVQRQGSGTTIYINRGSRHGAKRNQRAKLCRRHRAVVTKVYPSRSTLRSSASVEQIGECKSVVISR